MSNGHAPNPLRQWREARRQLRRAVLPAGVNAAAEKLKVLEAQMTPKQLAQVREQTTEGAS